MYEGSPDPASPKHALATLGRKAHALRRGCRRLPVVAIFSLMIWGVGASRGGADPFDPRAYINAKEPAPPPAGPAPVLRSQGVYRISGKRFHKFSSDEGSVYLLNDSPILRVSEDIAICPQHLKLVGEVLQLRDGLPVEPEAQKQSGMILALIHRCHGGEVPGPVSRERQPDGATVETKARTNTLNSTKALGAQDTNGRPSVPPAPH